ncbi:MAG: 16S rRNA (uracil(1498)-N(3))-methyltransferase [Ignavibacterium sp.]|uniref:16S rRNA (uracil(1498)-N(3))-methyltransferase n=1 Tax=Ignavibacterium sp. TaxID=2651167 RepID=UPI0032975BE2
MEKQNGYLTLEWLSDIELFYSEEVSSDSIILSNDEFHHCTKVFRKKIGDEIFITDGKGKIYNCTIEKTGKKELKAVINSSVSFEEKFPNYIFCIPLLRNKDRFRFAIEKLIEQGITRIFLFKAQRTVSEKINIDKLNKIAIETIKQSLQSILPEFKVVSSLKELNKYKGNKIIFNQKSELKFDKKFINESEPHYFIFGPEGGLTEEERELLLDKNIYSLADNRLRSETAIIKAASIITL